MADIVDRAQPWIEEQLEYHLAQARAKITTIPVGEPGECDRCGRDLPRLVDGFCARCRDELRLP